MKLKLTITASIGIMLGIGTIPLYYDLIGQLDQFKDSIKYYLTVANLATKKNIDSYIVVPKTTKAILVEK
jgi:hypothetical protein